MWGPYFFLVNPGYFLAIAFLAPASACLTPAGDTRRCSASTAAGPVRDIGVFFVGALVAVFLTAGFFIFGIVVSLDECAIFFCEQFIYVDNCSFAYLVAR